MTAFEISLVLSGARAREQEDSELAITTAWMTAVLQRGKKVTPLKRLLGAVRKPAKKPATEVDSMRARLAEIQRREAEHG